MAAIASRKNTLILGFTLLVVLLGYGMVPVIPFLITQLGASGRDLGVLTSVYAAMQLVCAPFWGALSDRIGRKPVLLIGVLGYAITMIAFGLSTRFWMLFVARSFSGVLSSGILPSALAYLSDYLPAKERGSAMGQLGAASSLGLVLGPLLGWLLSTGSLSLPFFIGAYLALLLVYLLLPEVCSIQPAANSDCQFIFLHCAFFGIPGAILGEIVSIIMGWIPDKSMVETGGLFVGWWIHFLSDSAIFSFVTMTFL